MKNNVDAMGHGKVIGMLKKTKDNMETSKEKNKEFSQNWMSKDQLKIRNLQ